MGADFSCVIIQFMDERAIIAYVGAIITFHGAIISFVSAIVTFHGAIISFVRAMINLTYPLSSLHPIITFHGAILVFFYAIITFLSCNKHPYW